MGDQNLNGKLYRPLQGFTEMIVVLSSTLWQARRF